MPKRDYYADLAAIFARDVEIWLYGNTERAARKEGLHFDIMSTSFFLSRRALKPSAHSGMPRWQDRLFIGLARSANDASDFFRIPTGRVVEVGTQVTV
jgi:KUP system potassium uptake protein